MTDPVSYAAAGVDVEAGERAVALMRSAVAATSRPEVMGGLGGSGGLLNVSVARGMRRPVLATSTDGVGTKIEVARRMDIHHTVGIDLVAMVVDDLVVCGAEPLFLTDYIAVGKVDPVRVADIVSGVAAGCAQAGCALLGGETAEHPGLLKPDEYDIAGAGTGIVDADHILGSERVALGDSVIAIGASGLHSNGYSLARHIAFTVLGMDVHDDVAEFGRTLGEELLEPTRIYARDILSLVGAVNVHAVSHITGGGIAANLARVLPEWAALDVDRETWRPAAVFDFLIARGGVAIAEAERTFNMGVGMVVIVPTDEADDSIEHLRQRDLPAWQVGTVRQRRTGETGDAAAKGGGGGAVSLVGSHSPR